MRNPGDENDDPFFATLGSAARAVPRSAEQPAMTPTEDETLPDTGKYEAFKAVDRDQFCLSIYTCDTRNAANAHPAYQYYQYLLDDRRGRIFDIVFSFFVVRVRGRNLNSVIYAIKSKKCVFIQQYQRRAEWPRPADSECVIEEIEIVYQPAARTALLEKGAAPAVKEPA